MSRTVDISSVLTSLRACVCEAHALGTRSTQISFRGVYLVSSSKKLRSTFRGIFGLYCNLEIVVNLEKSGLVPVQQVKLLGMVVDLAASRICSSNSRITILREGIAQFFAIMTPRSRLGKGLHLLPPDLEGF